MRNSAKRHLINRKVFVHKVRSCKSYCNLSELLSFCSYMSGLCKVMLTSTCCKLESYILLIVNMVRLISCTRETKYEYQGVNVKHQGQLE